MPASKLYPLRFAPVYKDKIWGGSRINEVLGRNEASTGCGESWEISGLRENPSVVTNGPLAGQSLRDILEKHGTDLMGQRLYRLHKNEFPLLIKFIDASADLSIQVHPNDEQSGGQGKSEMWYILDAEPDASLLCGFASSPSKEEVKVSIEEGGFENLLNKVPVQPGDTFYIPANRVHTIGKGILLAEIQQSSDITYRIYDFNRTDSQGNRRQLHVEQALEVMDYGTDNGKVEDLQNGCLVSNQYFTTEKFEIVSEQTFEAIDSFRILINVGGSGDLHYDGGEERLEYGQTLLIPAAMEVRFRSNSPSTLLSSYVS